MRDKQAEGGRWGLTPIEIRAKIEDVAMDCDLKERWPRTSQLLDQLAEILFETIDDMDLALSGVGGTVHDGALEGRLEDLMKEIKFFDDAGLDNRRPRVEGS